VVDEAIRFLYQRDPECPFFLYVVFEAPHSPFDPPAPYDRMYDNFTIPAPRRAAWQDDAEPAGFAGRRLGRNSDHLTPEMIAESRRRYYGQISHIDYQLGRLFGELTTRGLYNDTAICFTADHGEHLGDYDLWAKSTFLQGSGDVPLQLRLPESRVEERRAQVVTTPVLTADIVPTFYDLAGLEADAACDGTSLLPVLAGEKGNRVIHGVCGGTAFACDRRWKYIYYTDGGVEHLFDNEADPTDCESRAADPPCTAEVERLRASLKAYLAKHNSPLLEDGELAVREVQVDEARARADNPFAYRGPMRYGQGYDGWSG
jgi:arylsulfatase A-like enzyme